MTEYAYSRKEPCISSTTSMSRIFSSYESSGGGVFVLRRAIAAAAPSQSLPGHERVLTRTIVDRPTDNVDRDPSVAPPRDAPRAPRRPLPNGPRARCPAAPGPLRGGARRVRGNVSGTRASLALGVRGAGTSPAVRT